MKCRKCGYEMGEAKFCPECGEKRIDLEEDLFEEGPSYERSSDEDPRFETIYESSSEEEGRYESKREDEEFKNFDESTYTYKSDPKEKPGSFTVSEPKRDLKSDGVYKAIVSFRKFLDPLIFWINRNRPLSTVLLVTALLISNFGMYIALGALGLDSLAVALIIFYLVGIGINFLITKMVANFSLGKYKVRSFSNNRILLFMNLDGILASILSLLKVGDSILLSVIITIPTALLTSFIFISLSIDLFDNRYYQTVGLRYILINILISMLVGLLAGVIIAIVANIFNSTMNTTINTFNSFFNGF